MGWLAIIIQQTVIVFDWLKTWAVTKIDETKYKNRNSFVVAAEAQKHFYVCFFDISHT